MKFYMTLLSLVFFLNACSDSGKEFNESDYTVLSDSEVNKISVLSESGSGNLYNQLLVKGKEDELSTLLNHDLLYYRFYVNEEGNVDEIKVLHNNGNLLSVDENNITNMKKWQFALSGNRTKYKFDYVFTQKEIDEEDYLKIVVPGEDAMLDKKFFDNVSSFPEIVGGINALAQRIIYPIEAKESGLQGSVFIRAFINKTGEVEKVMVTRGIGSGCDIAALTAVCKIKFLPATIEGEPVNVQVMIPIKFRLDEK